MSRKPTERQIEYLRAIVNLTEKLGYPPAVRDIAWAVGAMSTSTVAGFLNRLRAKGLVEWEPGKSRTLRLTEAGWRVYWEVERSATG